MLSRKPVAGHVAVDSHNVVHIGETKRGIRPPFVVEWTNKNSLSMINHIQTNSLSGSESGGEIQKWHVSLCEGCFPKAIRRK